uniref:Uncharacterized protein n=1 Tax=Oryza sativa subsp. japonica TaxID=39947 RepID=Q6K5Z4_ORYSJ|nr:hypothetical protein [Oryza sativa Japonica Group]
MAQGAEETRQIFFYAKEGASFLTPATSSSSPTLMITQTPAEDHWGNSPPSWSEACRAIDRGTYFAVELRWSYGVVVDDAASASPFSDAWTTKNATGFLA